MQVFGHGHITIGLGEELCTAEVTLDLFEELGHSDVVALREELGHRNVVCRLIQELSDTDIIISQEFGNRDVVCDLIEVLSDLFLQEFSDGHIIGHGQILCDVLHIDLQ